MFLSDVHMIQSMLENLNVKKMFVCVARARASECVSLVHNHFGVRVGNESEVCALALHRDLEQ